MISGLIHRPASHTPPFAPFVATVLATNTIHSINRTPKANRLPFLFVAMVGVPTEVVGPKASVESSPPHPSSSRSL